MQRPDLSGLSINDKVHDKVHDRWLTACGTMPAFESWKNMHSKEKYHLLHEVAANADNDTEPNGDYLSAYEQVDIDDMDAGRRQWSVEHVVPRSHINDGNPAVGENDPIGWIEATAEANSLRSNHPLYLWPDPDDMLAPPNRLVRVDGELHYVPPYEQRGRLARKWLFIRATYPKIKPPSMAQRNRAAEIVALAQHDPIHPAERRVNKHYRATLHWANPLLEDGAEQWYGDVQWRSAIFGLGSRK